MNDIFICPAKFSLKKIRQTPTCNIELLLNHNINIHDCKIIIKKLKDTYWKAWQNNGRKLDLLNTTQGRNTHPMPEL